MLLLTAICALGIAQAAEPTLPELLQDAPAVYPSGPLQRGVGAVVLLELEIDPTGSVVAAQVVGPAGEGFDEAALAAVTAFTFKPALDADGQPVSAVIQYRYVFEPDKAAVVAVEGLVRQAGERTPLADLRVSAVGPDGARAAAITGPDGRFELAGLAAGEWTLTASGPGLEPSEAVIATGPGKVVTITMYARALSDGFGGASEIIDVVGYRQAPEISERRIEQDELRVLPGSSGDLVRTIQNLPGVGRPSFNLGQLLVRGTGPDESVFTLDGVELPLVFHFGGLTTVLSTRLVDEVVFLPGTQSVRYGRVTGGVVDLRTVHGPPERSRGAVGLDLFQASVEVEQPFGRSGLRLSGRRSWVDAVVSPLAKASSTPLRAPRYYDGQVQFVHRGPDGVEVDAMALLADDRFAVLAVDEGDPPVVDIVSTFQKLKFGARIPTGRGVISETSVLGGPDRQTVSIGDDGEAVKTALTAHLRHEWARPIGDDDLGWRAGMEILGGRRGYRFQVPTFDTDETVQALTVEPALYAEPSVRIGPMVATPGVRADWMMLDSGYGGFVVDPRLTVQFELSDSVQLEAATGRWSRLPASRKLVEPLGTPALTAQHSQQNALGLIWLPSSSWEWRSTVYLNRLTDLVIGQENAFSFTDPVVLGPQDTDPWRNGGDGLIFGAESMLKWRNRRTFAWFTATVSRSLRRDDDTDWYPYRYDQPLNLIALVSHALPRDWRVGSRARFGLGNPYTKAVQHGFDLDNRRWVPVFDDLNSSRLPPAFQLDLRFDKTWTYERWRLVGYLDIANITNTRSVDLMAWTYDYRQETPIRGMPILPVFGLRGEW